MAPQWHFTFESLEKYMKVATKSWATHDVGTRIEAFAIAGCDPINLLTSSKKKAEYYKTKIRELIASKLRDITGNQNAVMQYSRYDEDIVMRYGVVLERWTYEKLINPSALSTSLPSLKMLHEALKKGDCKFVKLTSEQKKEWEKAYMERVQKGEVECCKRKKRSDAGVRRKTKRVRSNDQVSSDDDKENDSDDGDNSADANN
ncbi:hypothetical protein JR316_0003277 [Psilocybe cubensis]|uniref:Uncharacterized protein n=2 Tax=Psilocybe cubensis TaxID=181762 RepID=A0A8H8CMT3_PSICU|nr:hypothetical protein JR316_0003277 [Psilocybe cubensis]KAH9483800.1 hypothetical protein JR316_0003277 [Psilocybe cubensis]